MKKTLAIILVLQSLAVLPAYAEYRYGGGKRVDDSVRTKVDAFVSSLPDAKLAQIRSKVETLSKKRLSNGNRRLVDYLAFALASRDARDVPVRKKNVKSATAPNQRRNPDAPAVPQPLPAPTQSGSTGSGTSGKPAAKTVADVKALVGAYAEVDSSLQYADPSGNRYEIVPAGGKRVRIPDPQNVDWLFQFVTVQQMGASALLKVAQPSGPSGYEIVFAGWSKKPLGQASGTSPSPTEPRQDTQDAELSGVQSAIGADSYAKIQNYPNVVRSLRGYYRANGGEKLKTAFDGTKSTALSLIHGKSSDREKLGALYGWIVSNVAYLRSPSQTTDASGTKGKPDGSFLSAFEYRATACGGYSELFQVMSAFAGVPMSLEAGYIGDGSIAHAWNRSGDLYYDTTLGADSHNGPAQYAVPRDVFFLSHFVSEAEAKDQGATNANVCAAFKAYPTGRHPALSWFEGKVDCGSIGKSVTISASDLKKSAKYVRIDDATSGRLTVSESGVQFFEGFLKVSNGLWTLSDANGKAVTEPLVKPSGPFNASTDMVFAADLPKAEAQTALEKDVGLLKISGLDQSDVANSVVTVQLLPTPQLENTYVTLRYYVTKDWVRK